MVYMHQIQFTKPSNCTEIHANNWNVEVYTRIVLYRTRYRHLVVRNSALKVYTVALEKRCTLLCSLSSFVRLDIHSAGSDRLYHCRWFNTSLLVESIRHCTWSPRIRQLSKRNSLSWNGIACFFCTVRPIYRMYVKADTELMTVSITVLKDWPFIKILSLANIAVNWWSSRLILESHRTCYSTLWKLAQSETGVLFNDRLVIKLT